MTTRQERIEQRLRRGVAGQAGSIVEAEWLDPSALHGEEWRYRDDAGRFGGLLLGYWDGRGIGTTDNRHVLTVAGSRGGKGVSLIIPNLLMYEGSVLALDPKGELAAITARARRDMGQKVVVLDPFGESGIASGSFNPLDQLDPASDLVIDDAGQIADALIIANDKDPHWTDSARILVKALILFALLMEKKNERNLVTVQRLLTCNHPAVDHIANYAKLKGPAALGRLLQGQAEAFGGVVAAAGKSLTDMAEKERDSVLSTARTQLEFLESPRLQAILGTSDLSLDELKKRPTTLYLCLPATRMGTHARWLRVIINLALVAFERVKQAPDIPALMVLDEFAVLGPMKTVELAAGLMAGFGVKLWIVLQDLSQVKKHYRDSWETFMGNAGVATFWSNSDKTTLDYISERLGQTSVHVTQHNETTMQQRLSGSSGRREELRVQRLAAAHELEQMLAREEMSILVLKAGRAPVVLIRAEYHKDAPFAGRFDVPPRMGKVLATK
jgi:type IV secretion system protein VirD4